MKPLAAAVLLCACAGAQAADDIVVRLTYVRYEENARSRSLQPQGYAPLVCESKAPAGYGELPALNAKQPLFATLALGGEKRLLIFDRDRKGDLFLQRLWIDRNGNGDLRDDSPLRGEASHSEDNRYVSVEFPSIEMEIATGAARSPFRFRVELGGYGLKDLRDGKLDLKEGGIQAYATSGCCYTGLVAVGARRYQAILADMDCDGRFDMPAQRREIVLEGGKKRFLLEGDKFFLGTGTLGYDDGQYLGRYLMLEDALFALRVRIAEKTLTLTPVREDCAPLDLKMGVDQMFLLGDNPAESVALFQPSRKPMLPAGRYRLAGYVATRTDPQGDVWRIKAAGALDASPFRLEPQGARPAFGEPFVPAVEIPDWYRDNWATGRTDTLRLSFALTGAGGERVTDISRVKGTRTAVTMSARARSRPAEPSYRIVTGDGEVVASGSFEYG